MSQLWDYTLDTDNLVTTGQLRLNDDGTVDQRVWLSGRKNYEEWKPSLRWDGQHTVESVEANVGRFYELTRRTEYQTTEDYIEGEYGGAVEDVRAIIDRFLDEGDAGGVQDTEGLALDIAGYFTGCLTVDGSPRVKRRRS